MRRREFISLVGGAAAAWPLVARGASSMSAEGHLTVAIVREAARRSIVPTAISLLLVGITTAILASIKVDMELDAIIFVFFLPTTIVAIQYGSVAAMIAIIASDISAAYFLYPPKLSIWVSDPLDVMGIIVFSLLAMMAAKVVSGFDRDPNVHQHKRRRLKTVA